MVQVLRLSRRLRSLTGVFLLILVAFLLPNCSFGETKSGATEGPVSSEVKSVDPSDWPWWRGPGRDGIAAPDQDPPLKWSETESILWSSPVPGQGHGSPTILGPRIFLATADYDAETQSVVCYDRDSGKQLWKTDVHRGGFLEGGHQKSNLASGSVGADGERVFANFLNGGAVHTTALSLEGELLWQTKISDFVIHQGFGSSPAIYKSLVIVSSDNKGGGAIVGLDRSSGEVVWRVERPKLPNYTSPIILNAAGRDQLILTGCERVTSLDPMTGEKLWEVEGSTTEVVTSAVTDGELIFGSGGYPKRHVAAVRADGSGELVWEKNVGVYVPSMLVRDGYIFLVTDNGIAQCWKSATGEEIWKGRLSGTFSASPVLVGDRIYATNEVGNTFIFEANTSEFKLLGENQLGENVMATPTIVDSRIYMRVAHGKGGTRSETLYSIGR